MYQTDEERIALIQKIKAEAEASSTFKRHQMVRACRSTGMKMVDGFWQDMGHDHDNPDHHFDTRVVGWDTFGRIQVATEITNNPHCSEWCWSDDLLTPRSGWDWFADREDDRIWQKVGSPIFFMWEEPGWKTGFSKFLDADHYAVGDTVRAELVGPHIHYGDWIVRYEKAKKDLWITRVLNERQMWQREE